MRIKAAFALAAAFAALLAMAAPIPRDTDGGAYAAEQAR
jgi:hypothetical protein